MWKIPDSQLIKNNNNGEAVEFVISFSAAFTQSAHEITRRHAVQSARHHPARCTQHNTTVTYHGWASMYR